MQALLFRCLFHYWRANVDPEQLAEMAWKDLSRERRSVQPFPRTRGMLPPHPSVLGACLQTPSGDALHLQTDHGLDGEEGEIAKALVGTAQGNAVVFFLGQHLSQLGKKKTIGQVRLWGDDSAGAKHYDRNFLYEIVDV